MNLKFLKKSDIILVAVLLIACVALLLPKYLGNKDTKLTAVIMRDGVVLESVDLSTVEEPYEYDLDCSPKAVITICHDCVYYSYAECHDKLCMNTGKLKNAGDTAACLPSKTLVVLEGTKDKNAPDAITY